MAEGIDIANLLFLEKLIIGLITNSFLDLSAVPLILL
jgi:hypothetical protein